MNSIFSQRLKEERLNQNITQQEFADLINEELAVEGEPSTKVSRVSITRYENGTRTPDYETLCTISFILDVDLDYLLGKSDKKHIEATNIQLHDFLNVVSDIIAKDDLNLNKSLWALINDFSNLINQGNKNNLLPYMSELFLCINGIVNRSINTKEPKILHELKKIITLYHNYLNNKSIIELLNKQLDQIKKSKDTIKNDIKTCKKYTGKNNDTLQKVLVQLIKEQWKLEQRIIRINRKQKKIDEFLYEANDN